MTLNTHRSQSDKRKLFKFELVNFQNSLETFWGCFKSNCSWAAVSEPNRENILRFMILFQNFGFNLAGPYVRVRENKHGSTHLRQKFQPTSRFDLSDFADVIVTILYKSVVYCFKFHHSSFICIFSIFSA